MDSSPYAPSHTDLADRLAAAYREYLDTCSALTAIQQCDSYWPSDLPGPDYPGTRCDLLAGQHVHRARVPGSAVVVTW